MTLPLSTSDAALLEATEDPRVYIPRFLHLRDMDDQVIPWGEVIPDAVDGAGSVDTH